MSYITGYWFDSSGQINLSPDDTVIQEKQNSETKKHSYCCAVCKNKITSDACAITVEGEHNHCKINPVGRRYQLRCFSSAAGCGISGEPSSYFSWFNGYSWRFAHCGQCNIQLGWFFEGSSHFFGLIEEQIIRCDN